MRTRLVSPWPSAARTVIVLRQQRSRCGCCPTYGSRFATAFLLQNAIAPVQGTCILIANAVAAKCPAGSNLSTWPAPEPMPEDHFVVDLVSFQARLGASAVGTVSCCGWCEPKRTDFRRALPVDPSNCFRSSACSGMTPGRCVASMCVVRARMIGPVPAAECA